MSYCALIFTIPSTIQGSGTFLKIFKSRCRYLYIYIFPLKVSCMSIEKLLTYYFQLLNLKIHCSAVLCNHCPTPDDVGQLSFFLYRLEKLKSKLFTLGSSSWLKDNKNLLIFSTANYTQGIRIALFWIYVSIDNKWVEKTTIYYV